MVQKDITHQVKEITVVCVVCNKSFIANRKNRLYCTKKCRHKFDRQNKPEKIKLYAKTHYENKRLANRVEQTIWENARGRARQHNIPFTITVEDILKCPQFCPILGLELKRNFKIAGPDSPSLDRIDNSKGYILGNVRIISNKANSNKGNLSLAEIERLYHYSLGLI